MGKLLFIVILIAAVYFGITYISHLRKGPVTCPAGERFVRKVTGGGWADTDPTDPAGQCVSESDIQASLGN